MVPLSLSAALTHMMSHDLMDKRSWSWSQECWSVGGPAAPPLNSYCRVVIFNCRLEHIENPGPTLQPQRNTSQFACDRCYKSDDACRVKELRLRLMQQGSSGRSWQNNKEQIQTAQGLSVGAGGCRDSSDNVKDTKLKSVNQPKYWVKTANTEMSLWVLDMQSPMKAVEVLASGRSSASHSPLHMWISVSPAEPHSHTHSAEKEFFTLDDIMHFKIAFLGSLEMDSTFKPQRMADLVCVFKCQQLHRRCLNNGWFWLYSTLYSSGIYRAATINPLIKQ